MCTYTVLNLISWVISAATIPLFVVAWRGRNTVKNAVAELHASRDRYLDLTEEAEKHLGVLDRNAEEEILARADEIRARKTGAQPQPA